SERDVLAIATVVGEAERALVDHLDETLRAATVLNVRLAVGRGSRQKRGVLLGDEGGKLRRDRIGKAMLDPAHVGGGRATLGLGAAHSRRKNHVTVVGRHGGPRSLAIPR